jgi:hypothetical protein
MLTGSIAALEDALQRAPLGVSRGREIVGAAFDHAPLAGVME